MNFLVLGCDDHFAYFEVQRLNHNKDKMFLSTLWKCELKIAKSIKVKRIVFFFFFCNIYVLNHNVIFHHCSILNITFLVEDIIVIVKFTFYKVWNVWICFREFHKPFSLP